MGNENIDSHEGINSGLIGRRKLVKSVGGLALASAGMFAAGPMGLQSVAKAQSDSSGNYTSIYNVRDYGATGNGSTDDRPAIQSAINAAISNDGGIVFLPAATYALGDTLQIRSSNIVLQGAGTGSVLKATFPDGNVIYAGQPTPSSPQTINVQFRNFAIVASVVKSSGAAIFCERAQRFIMEDVKASAQEAQNNLYDGFYFQLFDTCVISNCQIVHRHAGVTANGQPNQAFGAGLWIIGGSRIIANDTPGSIGVHLGGSTGGIAIEDTDIIVNETGVLLDDTLSGATNREVFLNQCFVDSSANYGVDVMPGGVAVLHFNNTWLASSGRPNTKGFPDGANIHVRKGGITNVPSVIVDGCRVFNAFGSGIEAYSGAWTITGSDIEFNGLGDNGGYGILLGDPSVSNVVISGNNIRHNGTPAGQKPRTLGEGIHVARGVNDYIITSNIVRQNASAQIVDEGGPDRIVKNNLTRKNRS